MGTRSSCLSLQSHLWGIISPHSELSEYLDGIQWMSYSNLSHSSEHAYIMLQMLHFLANPYQLRYPAHQSSICSLGLHKHNTKTNECVNEVMVTTLNFLLPSHDTLSLTIDTLLWWTKDRFTGPLRGVAVVRRREKCNCAQRTVTKYFTSIKLLQI